MKKTNAFRLVFLVFGVICLAAALAACGDDKDGGERPEINGMEKPWNRIEVFVPDGMELAGSANDSADSDIVYVQDSEDKTKYFLLALCTEQSAKDDVESNKTAFNGDYVNFMADNTEWNGVKYKLGGEADCFVVYATINGQTVLVIGSRYACDSDEAKVVLGSIKINDVIG